MRSWCQWHACGCLTALVCPVTKGTRVYRWRPNNITDLLCGHFFRLVDRKRVSQYKCSTAHLFALAIREFLCEQKFCGHCNFGTECMFWLFYQSRVADLTSVCQGPAGGVKHHHLAATHGHPQLTCNKQTRANTHSYFTILNEKFVNPPVKLHVKIIH